MLRRNFGDELSDAAAGLATVVDMADEGLIPAEHAAVLLAERLAEYRRARRRLRLFVAIAAIAARSREANHLAVAS